MFTIYNEDEEREEKVEEPDPSYIYTYADYYQWKFLERLELFRGKVFKMAAPSPMHQIILANLHLKWGPFLKKQPCKVFLAPFDVRLPLKGGTNDDQITTVVQPDLSVICDPSKIDSRGCCGAPDVTVEIISPGNSKKDILLKFDLYEEAGVKEYWIIEPRGKTATIHLLDENGKYSNCRRYACGDRISSTVIPGFEIQDLSEIFEE